MERFACPRPDRRGRFRCIDDRALCDGFYDCPDKEDENPDHCLFYKTVRIETNPERPTRNNLSIWISDQSSSGHSGRSSTALGQRTLIISRLIRSAHCFSFYLLIYYYNYYNFYYYPDYQVTRPSMDCTAWGWPVPTRDRLAVNEIISVYSNNPSCENDIIHDCNKYP